MRSGGSNQGNAKFLLAPLFIRIAFSRTDCLPAPFATKQAPTTPTASTGKQPQLPVACLASQEVQHRRRVGAFHPFLLGHGSILVGVLLAVVQIYPGTPRNASNNSSRPNAR